MEKNKRMRRYLTGLLIFGILMVFFALLSRGIYASKLPQVTTEMPRSGTITHRVEAAGTVVQSRELAVNVAAGLRIREILVKPGDRVEAGDALLVLDIDHLEELLAEQNLEIEKMELQIAALNYNRNLAEEEKVRQMNQANLDGLEEIEDAQVRIGRAEEDEKEAKRNLDAHLAKTDDCQTEADWELWEQERKPLAQQYEQARRELEDAKENLEDVMAGITRRQQEVTSPLQTDASGTIQYLELEQKKADRELLQNCLQKQGIVEAPMESVITRVSASAGELTGSGAVISYGDLSQPFFFEAYLRPEEKKYVEQGMDAMLRLSGQTQTKQTAVIDYLTPSEDGNSYRIRILLPKGQGTIGQSGTLETSVQSEVYSICVPLEAVHTDVGGRAWVNVLEEADTVLGTELVVRRISVEVLDQNTERAAVTSAAIDEQTEVIVTSTAEYKNGEVVRRKAVSGD